jgi:DNA-binding FrmR family transcriptional regulator
MIEEHRDCMDVLTPLKAARAALVGVETDLFKQHLSHCIEGAIASGDEDEQRRKAAERIQLFERAAR